jgi:hypothetical protein
MLVSCHCFVVVFRSLSPHTLFILLFHHRLSYGELFTALSPVATG